LKTFLPPLDAQEEKKVLQEMQGGSLEARNTLIVHNMRLVAHIVKKYQNAEEDMEETAAGGLHKYANPSLIAKEKDAWREAVIRKHAQE